ncbi:hypothetical protein JEQ12_003939 [Ovis aries]|uniref:Uncharacterized protein n=1 Tax=Ovis aries TaxID=9940 RepID=A0A835ZXV5_SHEEP|nr:hypothetical protein JEQ12_003939 [Ovis aries]
MPVQSLVGNQDSTNCAGQPPKREKSRQQEVTAEESALISALNTVPRPSFPGTWTPEHLCSVSGSPTPSVPASDFRKSSEGAAQPSEIPPPPPPLGDFLSQGKQDDLAPVLEFQNQAGINLPELTCLLNTELNANAPFLWASPLHATPTPTK